jgi:hypothetical protein
MRQMQDGFGQKRSGDAAAIVGPASPATPHRHKSIQTYQGQGAHELLHPLADRPQLLLQRWKQLPLQHVSEYRRQLL